MVNKVMFEDLAAGYKKDCEKKREIWVMLS